MKKKKKENAATKSMKGIKAGSNSRYMLTLLNATVKIC